ncbi:hypothetical protein FQN57_003568 [Myotisia sp. PD_48]|nr:hypothetical protein FQN57_003568 [Myotisia sp. PD_48]
MMKVKSDLRLEKSKITNLQIDSELQLSDLESVRVAVLKEAAGIALPSHCHLQRNQVAHRGSIRSDLRVLKFRDNGSNPELLLGFNQLYGIGFEYFSKLLNAPDRLIEICNKQAHMKMLHGFTPEVESVIAKCDTIINQFKAWESDGNTFDVDDSYQESLTDILSYSPST